MRPRSTVDHLAIDAIQSEPQASCPHAIADESRNEILHEMGRDRDDGLLRRDRFEKLAQSVIGWRRDDEGKRLGRTAERLIEALQKLGRKARSEGCARLVDQGADALEAQPPQRACAVSGERRRASMGKAARCLSFLSRSAGRRSRRDESAKGPRPLRPYRRRPAAPAGRNDSSRRERSASNISSPPKRWAAP